ncbi:AraC family transcriptional regulator [Siccirubricoccus phaeus]|uniref:AraC family transcriptional regulator n=1 Tax=Siccirubricoccus phaeus TaxID=2595053 RepID=UPI0011F37259|nr:AraC family transcriptional regulator [Siccirubricoccus phaeus]
MDAIAAAPALRRVEPLCRDWRSASWRDGSFDTARRDLTAAVEGIIRLPHPLVLVTLRGGAERLEVRSECGHRYAGPDRPGAVSFIPAHATRQLRFTSVRAEWASLALHPAAFEGFGQPACGAFTNAEDPFLAALIGGFARRLTADGLLDPLWCEAMGRAAAAHLAARHGPARALPRAHRLAPWQLRRIAEHVEARLAEPLRIAELAALLGLSAGYFHRAFRATTGQTPLAFITEARLRRAQAILAAERPGIVALAARVGFASPGHFARLYRAHTGLPPGAARRRDAPSGPG